MKSLFYSIILIIFFNSCRKESSLPLGMRNTMTDSAITAAVAKNTGSVFERKDSAHICYSAGVYLSQPLDYLSVVLSNDSIRTIILEYGSGIDLHKQFSDLFDSLYVTYGEPDIFRPYAVAWDKDHAHISLMRSEHDYNMIVFSF